MILLAPTLAFASLDTNLKYGMTGTKVIELQEFLIAKGFLKSEPTGNFFSLTRGAVVAYQTSQAIPSTGYVGILTRTAINSELAKDDTLSNEQEVVETGTTTPIVIPKVGGSEPIIKTQTIIQMTSITLGEKVCKSGIAIYPIEVSGDYDEVVRKATVTKDGEVSGYNAGAKAFNGDSKPKVLPDISSDDIGFGGTVTYTLTAKLNGEEVATDSGSVVIEACE